MREALLSLLPELSVRHHFSDHGIRRKEGAMVRGVQEENMLVIIGKMKGVHPAFVG